MLELVNNQIKSTQLYINTIDLIRFDYWQAPTSQFCSDINAMFSHGGRQDLLGGELSVITVLSHRKSSRQPKQRQENMASHISPSASPVQRWVLLQTSKDATCRDYTSEHSDTTSCCLLYYTKCVHALAAESVACKCVRFFSSSLVKVIVCIYSCRTAADRCWERVGRLTKSSRSKSCRLSGSQLKSFSSTYVESWTAYIHRSMPHVRITSSPGS